MSRNYGLGQRDTLTSGAATGSVVGLLAFGTWAATVAAGEYARQTMWVSLATVPRRTVLYGTKLAAVAAVAAVGALASTVLSLGVVWATAPRGDHDLGNPAQLLGVVLAIACVAAVGAGVGVISRSPTSATAIVVVAVLFPKAIGGLLGSLEAWVVGSSPGTVITQIVGNSTLTSSESYPPGASLAAVTFVAVAIAIAAAGLYALQRRDG